MLGLKPNLGGPPGVKPDGRGGIDGELGITPEILKELIINMHQIIKNNKANNQTELKHNIQLKLFISEFKGICKIHLHK